MTSPHVFGDAGRQVLEQRESSLLPAQVRPRALRWMWLALAGILLALTVLVVLIGNQL
jgi:hypothetical protein